MSPIGDTRHCWNCSRQRCTDQLCRLWRWSCVHNGVIQRGVVGNDVSSGGIRTGARKGNSFGAPTRWRDTFLGWGCTDECLPFYLPFRSIPFFVSLSLSLSLSWLQVPPTSTTTCYPPCKCISGNEVRNGNLIPAPFHSIARTSIEWLDIDRVWGYFSEMGLGKNGD